MFSWLAVRPWGTHMLIQPCCTSPNVQVYSYTYLQGSYTESPSGLCRWPILPWKWQKKKLNITPQGRAAQGPGSREATSIISKRVWEAMVDCRLLLETQEIPCALLNLVGRHNMLEFAHCVPRTTKPRIVSHLNLSLVWPPEQILSWHALSTVGACPMKPSIQTQKEMYFVVSSQTISATFNPQHIS